MTAPPGAFVAAKRPAHRLDALDGLRTIAVFLVVLFHVSVPHFAAGFVGVDVFFVLSGYLITAGLLREMDRSGRIDLVRFWSRRVKRLMPAAMLVLVAVTVWAFAFADLFRRPSIGGDLWWTVFYVANWRFIGAANYFTADGSQSPLLHMWSLAVEEQFYFAWPLVLLAVVLIAARVHRARRAPGEPERSPVAAIAVVTVVLVVVSAVLLTLLWSPVAPDRAYQGIDTKAFEPLLGALLALALARPRTSTTLIRVAPWAGWLGLAVMVVCFAFMDGPSPFYFQGGAVIFSIATAAIVLAGAQAPGWIVSRVLAVAPMAYLGRISYGIYLWHWPLAVWLGAHGHFVWWKAVAVCVGSVGLAAPSYHFVETPVRVGRLADWLTTRRTYASAGVLMVAVALCATLLGGGPLAPWAARVLPQEPPRPNTILMVGDSVPQRLMPSLAPVGQAQGLTVASSTAGGCSPLGVRQQIAPDDTAGEGCLKVPDMQQTGLLNVRPSTVVWWSRYEVADRYRGDTLLRAGTPEFWAEQQRDFRSSTQRLTATGATLVVVLTERPGVGMKSRCSPTACHPFLERMVTQGELRLKWNSIVMAEAQRNDRLVTVTMDDAFCPGQPVKEGGPWGSSLCTDRTDQGGLVRPDGSHVDLETSGEQVSKTLLAKVVKATA